MLSNLDSVIFFFFHASKELYQEALTSDPSRIDFRDSTRFCELKIHSTYQILNGICEPKHVTDLVIFNDCIEQCGVDLP